MIVTTIFSTAGYIIIKSPPLQPDDGSSKSLESANDSESVVSIMTCDHSVKMSTHTLSLSQINGVSALERQREQWDHFPRLLDQVPISRLM